jgi:hypothetical protein
MYNSSSYDEDDLVTVNFADEKGFDCEIEGEVMRVHDDSIVCNATGMDSVIRFRISFSDDVIVKLLLDDKFKDSVVRYDVSEISRREKSELNQLLNQIDEDALDNISPVDDGTNGYESTDFDTAVQQGSNFIDDEKYIHTQAQ